VHFEFLLVIVDLIVGHVGLNFSNIISSLVRFEKYCITLINWFASHGFIIVWYHDVSMQIENMTIHP